MAVQDLSLGGPAIDGPNNRPHFCPSKSISSLRLPLHGVGDLAGLHVNGRGHAGAATSPYRPCTSRKPESSSVDDGVVDRCPNTSCCGEDTTIRLVSSNHVTSPMTTTSGVPSPRVMLLESVVAAACAKQIAQGGGIARATRIGTSRPASERNSHSEDVFGFPLQIPESTTSDYHNKLLLQMAESQLDCLKPEVISGSRSTNSPSHADRCLPRSRFASDAPISSTRPRDDGRRSCIPRDSVLERRSHRRRLSWPCLFDWDNGSDIHQGGVCGRNSVRRGNIILIGIDSCCSLPSTGRVAAEQKPVGSQDATGGGGSGGFRRAPVPCPNIILFVTSPTERNEPCADGVVVLGSGRNMARSEEGPSSMTPFSM